MAVPQIATELPLLVPGGVLTVVVSIVASRTLGDWLGVRRAVAWVLLLSVGLILSGTLSPLAGLGVDDPGPRTCDLSRMWPASLLDLSDGPDVAINVLMCVPLGFAIGLAPWSGRKVVVLGAAIALPFAIELVQLVVADLGRACQAADVVDNLTGLAFGTLTGMAARYLALALRS